MMLRAATLDLPRVAHGFFTREGGVSEGMFASLNCSIGSGDDRPKVEENQRRALAALGLPAQQLATAYQVHGNAALRVDAAWRYEDRPRGDALVTRTRGLAIGILTADCAPVLLADPDAGVVAAAHAGWRGALGGVLEAAIAAMEREGARRANIVSAIGPCIGAASYEVGPEFPARFLAEDAANARFFTSSARAGHAMFDLGAYVEARVERLGVKTVTRIAADTCAEAGRFFSYRRTCLRHETQFGHMLSAIALT
jgi:polyphenol oxidase